MASESNGAVAGSQPVAAPAGQRLPCRLVLLAGEGDSEAEQVLREYQGQEISGVKLHTDLQTLAQEHQGKMVAAEWLGSLGWTRFLWCRK